VSRRIVARWPLASAEAEVVSAVSTFHAKDDSAGSRAPRTVVTLTSTVSASSVTVKRHSSSAPRVAIASSIAHASSTAMRRSSISSSAKCSRAARPAVAVRSTPRYPPSAGTVSRTTSSPSTGSGCVRVTVAILPT
jgi:hypothetical protein